MHISTNIFVYLYKIINVVFFCPSKEPKISEYMSIKGRKEQEIHFFSCHRSTNDLNMSTNERTLNNLLALSYLLSVSDYFFTVVYVHFKYQCI